MKKRDRRATQAPVESAPGEADDAQQVHPAAPPASLSRIDYAAAPLVALVLAAAAFAYVGGTTQWDDLFYMNISQHTTPHPWVMNRYAHVYLQKAFFGLCGDALTGAKVFWSVLFFGTSVLIYWCAKLLANRHGTLIGLIAVLLFWCAPRIGRTAGETTTDVTVMFLMMLGTFIYLAFLGRAGWHRAVVLAALGLIFYWTVKSKETGLCLAVLFLGLGRGADGTLSRRQCFRDARWVLAGMLAGCLLLVLLDGACMGDPLFSLRPGNLGRLIDFNTGRYIHDEKNISLLRRMSDGPLLTVFLLYLLSARRLTGGQRRPGEILVWLMPLAVLAFLTIAAVRMRIDSTWRYLLPAIPLVCAWGAQFFCFELGDLSRLNLPPGRLPRALVAAALIGLAGMLVMSPLPVVLAWVRSAGWEIEGAFYEAVILSLATVGLLFCAGVVGRRGPGAVFLASACLLMVLHMPLQENLASLARRDVATLTEHRFMLLRIYGHEMRLDGDVKILVSTDTFQRLRMLGRDRMSNCWMFNVFFNEHLDYDQFLNGTWDDVLKGDYTYAILTWEDWQGIREKHKDDGRFTRLGGLYNARPDDLTKTVLLSRRP